MNPNRELQQVLNLAAEKFQRGDLTSAVTLSRQVLHYVPNEPNALRMLGLVALQRGDPSSAVTVLQQAVAVAPNFAPVHNNLGSALKACGNLEQAAESFRKAISLQPNDPAAHYNLGSVLHFLGEYDQALLSFDRAVSISPDHFGAHFNMGHTLRTLGKLEECVDAYRRALKIYPRSGEIYWAIANVKTHEISESDIKAMEFLLTEVGLPLESQLHTCFALAKAYEDSGQYSASFRVLDQGNQKKKSLISYNSSGWCRIVDRILAVFNEQYFSERRGFGYDGNAPVFIVSMPRTGSTLVEQILASHTLVTGGGELDLLTEFALNSEGQQDSYTDFLAHAVDYGRSEIRRLGQQYLEKTKPFTESTPFFTDKSLGNFPLVGLIATLFPMARFIHCRRNAMDTCFSCYKQLFARGHEYSYDLVDIGEYYLQYERLMGHWHEVIPGRIFDLDYENLVANQEEVTRELLEFCGLPWEDDCLSYHTTIRAVDTPSAGQVRQPIYSNAVERWKHYEQQLIPLVETIRRGSDQQIS